MTSLSAVVARAARAADDVQMRLKRAHPNLFGSPIRQNMIQLYRRDSDFDTIVSIPHHLSFLAPDTHIKITYGIRAFDRQGRLLATRKHDVKHFETLQKPLSELLDHELDEHGMFAVTCTYDSPNGIEFLGMTSPQFMTIFMPRSAQGAPQITHSHKYMDRFAPMKRKLMARHSSLFEGDSNLAGISYFLMNSSPMTTSGNINVKGPSGSINHPISVVRRGAARLDIDVSGEGPFEMTCELDRAINHRKPIVFRRFSSGMITAGHS
ncbi:MAG: hypothetical protein JWP25_7270 [Bradyrhizobium sp.]|nr:hypothetical protein [Bradyrhizobium sp.]